MLVKLSFQILDDLNEFLVLRSQSADVTFGGQVALGRIIILRLIDALSFLGLILIHFLILGIALVGFALFGGLLLLSLIGRLKQVSVQLGTSWQDVDLERQGNILADLELDWSGVNLANVSGHIVFLLTNLAKFLPLLLKIELKLTILGQPFKLFVKNEIRNTLNWLLAKFGSDSAVLALGESNWLGAPGLGSPNEVNPEVLPIQDILFLRLQAKDVAVDHQVTVPELRSKLWHLKISND